MLVNIQQSLATLINIKLKKLRFYFLINNSLRFLPFLVIFLFITFSLSSLFFYEDNQRYTFTLFIFFCALFLKLILLKRSHAFYNINRDNYLAHCNRHFETLEESAHLAFIDSKKLNVLQQIQQRKVSNELLLLLGELALENNKGIKQVLNGKIQSQISLVYTFLLCGGLWLYSPLLDLQKIYWQSKASQTNEGAANLNEIAKNNIDLSLIDSQIIILPPSYTKKPKLIQKELNIELLAGSEVIWQLEFSDTSQSYFIEFANGEINQLVLAENNQYTFKSIIEHTGVYKLYSQDNVFQQIYTLQVSLDKKPVIRILTPKNTVTEVEKNGKKSVFAQVNISDDYQISHVEILASIAKGSGESVKFRDQVFSFENIVVQTPLKNNQYQAIYEIMWDFHSLNMEPGDELYFTVKAWDNKQPSTQLTSSATKIIRWLEDEEQMVMADGILIDFMPEYFKSQRQIIIETKELISDEGQLDEEAFIETSELLGVAQSELKQKYGQYLGDEFDDGGAGLVPNISSEIEEEHHEDDEHEQDENHKLAQSVAANGHDHGVAGQTELEHSSDDKSGYSQLIETYAHNHEDTDIGMMSREDPKALMKQSIANMWQAELYLMLSKPRKALPFEEKALTLLKMAKKADRIYVKRLGFEPPPVSEQRRYQGDLSDILSENKQIKTDLTLTEQKQIGGLYQLVKQYSRAESVQKTPVVRFEPEQLSIMRSVNQILIKQLSNRPALIDDVATLERIILAGSLAIEGCENCIEKLNNKLWQLLKQPVALPNVRKSNYLMNDSLIDKYNALLIENKYSPMDNVK
jgi:hypothetical protein